MVILPNSAATIVDMQKCFTNKNGALYVTGTEEELKRYGTMETIIERINTFIHSYFYTGMYFTTEDIHPKNHREFTIFPEHAINETDGQKYNTRLMNIYNTATARLKKGQFPALFSYSLNTSPQWGEHIVELLDGGIKNIYIMGMAYNFCVGETAIAYACQGFNVYLMRDMTLSVPTPDAYLMDTKLDVYGIRVVTTNEI